MNVMRGGACALLATTSMLALATAAPAMAAAPAAAPAAEQSSTVGEVIVTAEKRTQTLVQVPVAISAYTSAKRDQIGIDSVQDMTNFTPGFVYNTGDDRVSIRGIGRYTNQLGADSSVGVYEDGAFETFTVKAGNDSIFVDRIEVLRGPQGTLYGRASIGGAINIISRLPTDYWYGEFRTMYDNYNQHIEEGAVSGPITDNLQFRVAASKTDQADGYFKNLSPGGPSQGNVRDEYYLEGQLQGKFGPHFDFWTKFFGGEWNNQGGNAGGKITNQVLVGADGKTPLANPLFAVNGGAETTDPLVPSLGAFQAPGVTNVVTTNPSGLNPGNQNIRNIYSTLPQYVRLRGYYGFTLKLNFHLDGMDIKYIGSGQHYSYVTHEEWGEGDQLASGVVSYVDPTGNTIFPNSILRYEETHWFATNEINFLSTSDSPLQWVAGVYNFNEGYKQPEEIALPGQAQLASPISVLTFGPAGPNPNRDVVFQEGHMGAETFAVFGQTDWKFAKDWKFTGGVRYSYDSKYGIDSARLLAFGPQIGVPVPVGIDLTQVALPNGGNFAVNGGLPPAERGASKTFYDPATGIASRKLYSNWGGWTATAGVQYDPDRDTNLYAKYSRGYKSGGFNSGFGIANNPETNPETSNDYQLGFKKNFGRTFTASIDLFYDQYYNAQIPISVASGALLSAQFYNVPEARSDGVELETTWQPTKALQFIFNYGYNGTDIVRSGCVVDASADPLGKNVGATPGNCAPIKNAAGVITSQPQDLKGDRLPEAPEHKLAFNTNYTFFLDPGSLSLSLSYVWRDVQYGSIFTRPFNAAPSWDQVDLRAEFKSANGHYSIIAYGKNIFDSTGYISGATGIFQSNGSFVKEFTLTPPALYGVELQYRF